jgi:type VI secretion system secreted protein VgrG
MFEDQKGQELIRVHAERDMLRSVEVDDNTTVGNDQREHVHHIQAIVVDDDRFVTVHKNEKRTIDIDQVNTIHGQQINTIDGSQISDIGNGKDPGGQFYTIGSLGQHTKIAGDQSTELTGNQTTLVDGLGVTHVKKKQTNVYDSGEDNFIKGSGLFTQVTGNTKIVTTGDRNDGTNQKHNIFANEIKIASNTKLDLVGINTVNIIGLDVSTTVMGNTTGGYIGSSKTANMGATTSFFAGSSTETKLGMSTSSFAGMSMEFALGIKMSGSAAISMEYAPIQIFSNSGPSATVEAVLASAGALVAAIASVSSAMNDPKATFQQYEDALKELKQIADEAHELGLTNLESRINSMIDVGKRRINDGLKNTAKRTVNPFSDALDDPAVDKLKNDKQQTQSAAGPKKTP